MLAWRMVSHGPSTENPAEMHDAVDADDGALDRGHVGEIGADKALVRGEIARRLDVAQPQFAIDALEQLPQPRADAARRPRDQNRLHDQSVANVERISWRRACRRAADSACGC